MRAAATDDDASVTAGPASTSSTDIRPRARELVLAPPSELAPPSSRYDGAPPGRRSQPPEMRSAAPSSTSAARRSRRAQRILPGQ
jgi:hypothetical protein